MEEVSLLVTAVHRRSVLGITQFTRFGGGDPIPALQVSDAAEPSRPFSVNKTH
jgi:serine/threonine protein kinase HipA of HipAB toxin-antitoxin module